MQALRVIANMIISIDGKITSSQYEPVAFSSSFDRQYMQQLRAQADAIVVGAQTIRIDNPPLHVCHQAQQPAQVVVSQSGQLPADCKFFQHAIPARKILMVDAAATPYVPAHIEVHRLPSLPHAINCHAIVAYLQHAGMHCILIEGGSRLLSQFFQQQLVHELYVTIAPTLLGSKNAPSLFDGTGFCMHNRTRLKLANIKTVDNQIFCHYLINQQNQLDP